jgi:hypothetical protein
VTTKVVNLRRDPYDVYIGRPGRGEAGYFGNPCVAGRVCGVCGQLHDGGGDTLGCFERYFNDRLKRDWEFRARVLGLVGKTLGCFCKPKPCHGDIIAAWVDGQAFAAAEASKSRQGTLKL